ncbi:hypothetical protein H8356DRAFT_1349916 [Neocallimastix lanati (nom. inval.)]|nr:hypothetical protein H8356DRAFT_1349916 [Neocallimastix sp. JGI-2020a]
MKEESFLINIKSENSTTTGSSSKNFNKDSKDNNEMMLLLNFHKWYSELKLFLDSEELASTNTQKTYPILFEIEIKIKKLEIENDDFMLNKNVLYSSDELNKVETYKDLKVDITKTNIKRVVIKEVYQYEDQINRVGNGKLPYNFNKETNSNEYCYHCHKNGHNTDNCSKRNYKSYHVNYEEQNNSDSDPL